ncbi:MAG: long-chain-fatty-acid--CoA ligase [bacterium]|nr:long-chain-fatty-acid--CoA ligase [bacterium]
MRENLGLFLAKRAALGPDLEALIEIERGRRFLYSELNARANRIAHALLEKGVRPGDRVALLMMNGAEYIESYFGIAKIGAVMVPLNWRLVPEELTFILSDSGSKVLLFDGEFDEPVAELLERDTPISSWIRVGAASDTPDFADDYDTLTAAASDEEPDIAAEGDDILFIMYTSGTTGQPKGVVHTHSSVTWASLTINMTADNRHGDRYLQMLPLFHVGALGPLTAGIHRGSAIVLMRAFDPSQVFPVIERERVTTALAVPAMLRLMLAADNHEEHDRTTLRWIMSGAAPVPVPLIEAYAAMGIEIHQVYGLTETGGPACLISPEAAISKAGSTGPAFLHTDVRVVDEQGQDVPPGKIGEVIVRGRHIMKEYWNRPDATAETLRDGWLYSGDLASMDEDGFVYIQDRKKDMIISGGENIYPAEVENALSAHPGVADVAVIGMPSPKWGESVAAIVVRRPGTEVTEDDVIQFCQTRLARFKQPRVVHFIDEIPRNPTGKILKRLLREQFPGPAPQ